MKRLSIFPTLFIFLTLLFCIAPSSGASEGNRLDVDVHLGLLSGAGVICNTGNWQFGLDLETPFPIQCIVDGIAGQIFNDLTFWEGFKLGLTDFFGADIYTYLRLLGNRGCRLYAGFDIIFGTEPAIKSFEAVLRPTTKIVFDLGEKTSLFLAGGFSLLSMVYVPGFEKPMIRIPNVSYNSVLTGCRAGLSFRLR